MALQLSVDVRNAILNAVESATGTSAKLQIRTGSPPANCAAGDSGILLAEISLPSDWMANAASGSKAKSGTWTVQAVASGVAGHFRVKDSAGTATHLQGNITAPGGGGTMTLDNTSIAVNQSVTINTFTLTAGNA
jgi:hypothetical protein